MATKLTVPIPQEPIGETFVWRDWFQRLSNKIQGLAGVDVSAPLEVTSGDTPTISMAAASATISGYLTSTDWTTFNSKQPAGSYLVNGGSLGTPSGGTLTNCTLPYTGLTGTIPTWNQNTTGSAATWTTARLLAGNSVNGSANVSFANAFVISQADGALTGAQNIGLLSTGLMKNTVTASVGVISTASAGTDYAAPTSGSSILYGNGEGGFSSVTVGTGLTFSAGTLSSSAGGGTVTHTAGALTSNSVVVGNGTADVKALDNVKVYDTDTAFNGSWPTLYGKIVFNAAGSTWQPTCGAAATGRDYADKFSLFPAVGLSSRGSAADCWSTGIHDYFSAAITDATLYNSHYVTYGTAVGIPAGLTSSASPAGSWNDPITSGGVPTDPYYTEIGGHAITLGVGTKGNYAEGIGLIVQDSPVFGGTPVEARLTGFQLAVKKDDPHNTWRSQGYMAYSMGTQQTTYAPLVAYAVAGGWQYGIDLSRGTYNLADIKFQSGTITSNATQLFVNVGGTTVGSWSATGLGINGAITGATSISATLLYGSLQGNATTVSGDNYQYTGTVTGLTATTTGTVYLARIGNVVTVDLPGLYGTSNASTMTLTGSTPTAMRPARDKQVLVGITDNSVINLGIAVIKTTGTIEFYQNVAGNPFTASGVKGFSNVSFSYTVN